MKMNHRLRGLIFLGLGLVLGYLSVYSPLHGAQMHEQKLSISLKAVCFCPIFVGFGLVYLIKGAKADLLLGTGRDIEPITWVFGIVLIVGGIALYLWVKSELERMGYSFGNGF